MGFPVVDLFVAEHRRDRIVADVVADADPTSEYFHGYVLVETLVEDHALGLLGGYGQGHVDLWPVMQRRDGDVGILLKQADAGQDLTESPVETWKTKVDIKIREKSIWNDSNVSVVLLIRKP